MSASVLSHKFAATCSFIALFASLPAFAQDQERSHADNPVMEEIVVVGSLIKRRVVYEGRAPVQTLDAELFDSVGAAQPVDILSSLTANTGSYIATQQNYLQGVSQFSLRGGGPVFHADADQWPQGRICAGFQRRGTELFRHQHAAGAAD